MLTTFSVQGASLAAIVANAHRAQPLLIRDINNGTMRAEMDMGDNGNTAVVIMALCLWPAYSDFYAMIYCLYPYPLHKNASKQPICRKNKGYVFVL